MSNTIKPRNQYLNNILANKRKSSGAHEPKLGKHLNRARIKEQYRIEGNA